MTRVDQFESAFRAAAKPVFEFRPPALHRVLVVTDLDGAAAEEFTASCRSFLRVLPPDTEWRSLDGGGYDDVAALLEAVEARAPSLVCTYRHLHSRAWKWPYGLGEYLDVLTQIAPCPVLVLPHPDRGGTLEHALQDTDRVMALTDHLTEDHRLVSWAVTFTEPDGTLFLTHVEDVSTFARFIAAIAKIPSIDTDDAREQVRARLLENPADYIESCRRILAGPRPDLQLEAIVTLGHRLADHERLIQEREVDLLVMNTKDDDQFAMHGLAYPLAVDLRKIPVLML